MGQPITWQTVRAGSDIAEAGRPLLASQASFNGAFEALNRILQQRQAIEVSNAQVGQEVGKQDYMDQLAQAKTPEELTALQQSGELEAKRQALGVQARAALRGADDARLTGLRQQQVASQLYGDSQQDRASMPIRNSIAELTSAGRFDEARESLDSSTTIRDKAPLLAAIAAAERARTTQGYADAKQAQEQALYPGEVRKQEASIGALEAQAKAALAQANQSNHAIKSADVAMKKLELDAVEAARKRFVDNSPLAYGSLDSKTGADALTEGLKAAGITGDAHDDIRQQLTKYFPGGKMTIKDKNGISMEVGVPVKTILEAIGASEENFLAKGVPMWSRRGDDMHNRLVGLLRNPTLHSELADTLEVLNMSPTRGKKGADGSW